MEWRDEGIILSVRPHGETSAIVELFTRDHGRHLGLVRGGRSRRNRPILQLGNHVDATWRARLAEHLGNLTAELRRGLAAEVMERKVALSGLMSLCALARLLPERDPHPSLYEVTQFVLGYLLDDEVWPALYVRWELALLEELGFGLDLTTCAATGSTDDLVFVSPKTGRAVSRDAGMPYADKLLRLPRFLRKDRRGEHEPSDVVDGLKLTAYFLERDVLLPRGLTMPETRTRLVGYLTSAQAGPQPSV